jgi:hypothetical protein
MIWNPADDATWSVVDQDEQPSEGEARAVLDLPEGAPVTIKRLIPLDETSAAELKASLLGKVRNEFGQRICSCGTANHDIRKRCRSCGAPL